MNHPFAPLPVLPIVIPIGVALFTVLLLRLRRRRLMSLPRVAVAAALAVYAAGIIGNTIFPIYLNAPDSGEPWTPSLALIPFYDYEVDDAVMNMLVFVPLGILIPLLLTRPTWWKVLLTVMATSLGIESTQLAAQGLFAGGHIADVNDFLFNTTGGMVGFALFVLLARMPFTSRLVNFFRWSTPASTRASAEYGAGPSRIPR